MDKKQMNEVLNWVGRRGISLISLLAGLMSAVSLTYGAYALYDTMYIEQTAEAPLLNKPEIIEDGETPLAGFGELQDINPDVGAWLTVYNTKIDYPVTQGKDDLEYVNKNAYGEYSPSGSIYLSSANRSDYSDSYSLVYGHHMDSGAMFGELEYFMEGAYFASHSSGVLITPAAVYDLSIFACLETDAYDDAIYGIQAVNSGEAGYAGLRTYIQENAAQYNPQMTDTGRILAMSTCAGATTNGRTIVFAYMTNRTAPTPEPTPVPEPTPTSEPTPTPTAPVTTPTAVTPAPAPTATAAPAPSTVPATVSEQPQESPSVSPVPPVTPEPTGNPVEDIEDTIVPLADRFTPRGGLGNRCWALLNLICLLLTIYIFLPLHKLRSKFGRRGLMKKLNKLYKEMRNSNLIVAAAENTAEDKKDKKLYHVKSFTVKFWIGVILELVISIVALLGFIHTEDMRLPMVIIDKWSLVMIIWLACCWMADLLLVRYRKKADTEDGQEA